MAGFGFLWSRRALGVAFVAVALIAALVLGLHTVAPAGADTVTKSVASTCSLGGLVGTQTLTFTTTDTPDPVAAGSSASLATTVGFPGLSGLSATLTSITATFPVPTNLSTISGVTFTGGNLKGSSSVHDGVVDVILTGPVAASSAVVPGFTLRGPVKSGVGGQVVTWLTPTAITMRLSVGTTSFTGVCVPPVTTLNTTAIGAVTTTTTSTTTTTRPTTTTTRPTTTTTRVSTTTTTRASTTTTRPTTTTTRASSTTTTASGAKPVMWTAGSVSAAFKVGSPGTLSIEIGNDASTTVAGSAYKLVVGLPAGFTYSSATGSGWSCSAAGTTVTCTQSASIAGGDDGPPLSLKAVAGTTGAKMVTLTLQTPAGAQIDYSEVDFTV